MIYQREELFGEISKNLLTYEERQCYNVKARFWVLYFVMRF